jgi:hypothetical protein
MISELQEIRAKHGNLPLVYSVDDEGNSFHEVYYSPSLGHYNKKCNEFSNEEGISEQREECIAGGYDINEDDYKINALCIN